MKLFISYSRADAGNFASHIHGYLIDNNHAVFTDVNSITIGDPWARSIEKNISECDIFVVILTPDSLRSSHVENEVLQAQKENKIIVPCKHQYVNYNQIKWGLENIQGIEFSDRYELALNLYAKITNYENLVQQKTIQDTNISELASETRDNIKNVSNIEHKNTDIINKTNLLSDQIKEKSDKLRRKNEANNLLKNVNIFINEKKYQEALECYDKALKIDPNNLEIRFWRIWLYHLANHKQDNLQEMNVSTETNVLISKGVTLHEEGKYQEALECYDKALKIDPNNVYVLFYQGLAFSNQGKYQEAIEWFDKALEIDRNNVVILNYKGNVLYDQKKYQETIECYDKALEIDPNNVDVLNDKGNVLLYDQKKYQEAIECYDKALEIDPNNVYVLINKGNVFYNQSRAEKALEYYDKALEIDPNLVKALYMKASVFHRQHYYKEAIVWYDKTLQIDPNYTLARKYKRRAKAARILDVVFPG